VVADAARLAGFSVVGFVDRTADAAADAPVPIVSESVLLEELQRHRLPVDAALVAPAIGANAARSRQLSVLGGWCAPAIVHPRSTVSESVMLARGTVVFAGAIVNARARVGQAVILNTAAVVEHDCVIGDCAHISPGAVLAGGVRVGDSAWVGANATVLPGIEIGEGAIVGAGAVVTRRVEPGDTVVGSPARSVSRRTT
jgi:sugar O-acyltransferase (sialic acid O-acetyltransferase NeuD family)